MPTTENIAQRQPRRTIRALHSMFTGVANWLSTCAQSYLAAALYQNLSQLSDAELSRRGLSRGSLASDVLEGSLSKNSRVSAIPSQTGRKRSQQNSDNTQEKNMRQNASVYSIAALQIAILGAILLWVVVMFAPDIMRISDGPSNFAEESILVGQVP